MLFLEVPLETYVHEPATHDWEESQTEAYSNVGTIVVDHIAHFWPASEGRTGVTFQGEGEPITVLLSYEEFQKRIQELLTEVNKRG